MLWWFPVYHFHWFFIDFLSDGAASMAVKGLIKPTCWVYVTSLSRHFTILNSGISLHKTSPLFLPCNPLQGPPLFLPCNPCKAPLFLPCNPLHNSLNTRFAFDRPGKPINAHQQFPNVGLLKQSQCLLTEKWYCCLVYQFKIDCWSLAKFGQGDHCTSNRRFHYTQTSVVVRINAAPSIRTESGKSIHNLWNWNGVFASIRRTRGWRSRLAVTLEMLCRWMIWTLYIATLASLEDQTAGPQTCWAGPFLQKSIYLLSVLLPKVLNRYGSLLHRKKERKKKGLRKQLRDSSCQIIFDFTSSVTRRFTSEDRITGQTPRLINALPREKLDTLS